MTSRPNLDETGATQEEASGHSRRTVLTGAGVLVVAATLSGCTRPEAQSLSDPAATLGPLSEVPVGAGRVFADAQVVVTQPTRGEFHAFSAIALTRDVQ
jgi:hypothetical protein